MHGQQNIKYKISAEATDSLFSKTSTPAPEPTQPSIKGAHCQGLERPGHAAIYSSQSTNLRSSHLIIGNSQLRKCRKNK